MVNNTRVAMSHKTGWKAVSLDYDFMLEQDDSTVFVVCLTELDRQILLAGLKSAAWKTRWFSDTREVDSDLVEAWVSRTALLLMENCMNCSSVYLVNQNIYALYVENLYQRYDGSTTSVNENCPTTNFDGDGSDERIQALCMGLNSYVKSYVKAWLQNAQIVLGLGTLALFLFAVPILGWVSVILIGGLAYVTQTYYDALSDEDAIENVICDWFDALQGVAITSSNWSSAMVGLSYDGGTHEFLIWQILCSEVGLEKQWVSFLDALGNAWLIAAAGVQDCPCGTCEPWDYEIDFKSGTQSFVGSPTTNRAVWEAGKGWKHGAFNNWLIQLISPVYSAFTLQAVTLKISIPATGLKRCQFRVPDAYGTSYDSAWQGSELEHTITLPGDGISLTRFWTGTDNWNVQWEGYLESVTLHGCGYNPFA